MDERNRTMIVVFMLCVIADMLAEGHTLHVCATCHANAICDDKSDGSGKVCNCKYGFVGNGRTFCQDKDECQLGASKICGKHTTCHNTYGSYYCTCLAGYSPSNNMAVFIPNDGTHCLDIDECRIAGSCGDGGQCRNLEGSFDCSCQLGYQVHNGTEPFHPYRDKASCRVVDCGQPASVEDTVLLSVTGTTYSSVAMFGCDEGFVWSSGDNSSVCGADGLWRGPTMVCEEVDCGVPPPIPHSIMLWDNISTVGSQVVYQCNFGYRNTGEGNVSVCTTRGKWDAASLLCQEINCQEPVSKPHAKMLWDGISHIGSVVYYQCDKGYYKRSLRNYSVCGENGLWEDIDLWCEGGCVLDYFLAWCSDFLQSMLVAWQPQIDEISCGPPLNLPHTNLLWDCTSRPGSVVLYECMDGFYQESGTNVSTCLLSGEWGKVSVKCKAKCGPIPFLANSEVVWHNRSVVIHRCVDGYHSWRGSNVSVCRNSGLWQKATLRCIEIKPPINHLFVLNEKCLHWKAEKYEEDTEVYMVTYIGSRDYQRSFRDKGKRFLSSMGDQLELCLNLLPVTNYSMSVTAVSARFTATITTNTSLPVPPAPIIYYREFETPVPTLRLRRSPNTLDPISWYQVFVLPVEGIVVFDCPSPDPSSKIKSSTEYITAQIDVRHVGTVMNFTVGDGLYYGGFFNAPLESGRNYYIILRAVSQWKTALKSSCVLWAKVRGTSYVLKVSSLSAAASVGLVALVILGGYSFTWFFKKT
ncbi:sushi domain-containing protein 1 isoform X9 [Dicentrarchus labrax]|uniref:sushi domain-containing protein 1 isoform X9 n=1 Tax=Dicentrarchus labrax TaxID=13489 RepID=UPI0021F6955D|nr:sushi domain-containing protein 1 isoform X9 [Dicentrarchus labrax]